MAVEIDAFAVLKAIGDSPRAFADVKVDATKAAKSMVIKQLKVKSLNLEGLGKIASSLGEEALALILEGVPGKDLKAVLRRVDQYNPSVKAKEIDEGWARGLLLSLASGLVQPIQQPPPKSSARLTERNSANRHTTGPIGTLSMRTKRVVGVR